MATRERLVGVGAFVVGGLLLFTIGLFMIGDRQMAFAKKFTIYTEFTRVTGIQPGAIVRVSGAKAGSVKDIVPPNRPSEKFRVQLELTEELHQLVRTDSVATIETEGLVGGSFLSIGIGSDAAPPAPAGSTIPSREPFMIADLLQQASDTMKKMNDTIDLLADDVQHAVQSVGETVDNANDLINDVSDDVKTIASAGARIAGDAAAIAQSIRAGKGTVGKLVNDEELYSRSVAIARRADEIATDVRNVVAEARQTLDSLKSNNSPVQGLTSNLRETLDEARAAVAGLSENMEALKHNFLFRGFFNRRGYFNLTDLSPAQYRRGVLTADGERNVVRVWLSAAVLFTKSSDRPNVESLSDDGKARLESAIAPYLDYLPGGIVMVEGYSSGGTQDEQFIRARARAASAREYLIGRFSLDPQATGLIALGAEAAGSPNNGSWDGIALAVYLEKRTLP